MAESAQTCPNPTHSANKAFIFNYLQINRERSDSEIRTGIQPNNYSVITLQLLVKT